MKYANKQYAEGTAFAINENYVGGTSASSTYTFSDKEKTELARNRNQQDADIVKKYDTVTIERTTDAYAKFISNLNQAEVNRYKSWGNTYDSVRVYWNSSNHRTDLSYFINTYITQGRSYDSTGNGYYLYYDKEAKATCQKLVEWINFFRNSYEQFRNLPEFSMSPDGEFRYIINEAGSRCIRVHIPFSAEKKSNYYDIRIEDTSIEETFNQSKLMLEEFKSDKPQENKTGTKKYVIAAAVIGLALVLKIIKKRKK